MSISLTPPQAAVLGFVKARIAADGVAPSVREIADHVGNRSLGAIVEHLKKLEERGHIRRFRGGHRAIELLANPNPFDAARDALVRVGAEPNAKNIATIATALTEARNAA